MAAKTKKAEKTEEVAKAPAFSNDKYRAPIIVRDANGDRIVCGAALATAKRRLAKRSVVDPTTGCWLWIGCRQQTGHGRMTFYKRPIEAHRLSYMVHAGLIPSGLELDHLCQTPNCINPDHLEPVTHRENVLRGHSIAARRARRSGCDHGHPFSEENTGVSAEGYRFCMECKRIQARLRYHKRTSQNNTLESVS